MDDKTETEGVGRLSLGALFSGFFQAGILGFGGVLPVARRIIVEQRQWLSEAAFNDLFSLCQFLPGANIVNLTFVLGARNGGLAGAAVAIAGLLAAPIAIVLCLGALYARYGGIPVVQHGLSGLAAAGAGLVMGTAMKIATPILIPTIIKNNRRDQSLSLRAAAPPTPRASLRPIFIACLAFGLVILAHFSLPLTMGLVLPLSILLAARE
jgi:chromate transporter